MGSQLSGTWQRTDRAPVVVRMTGTTALTVTGAATGVVGAVSGAGALVITLIERRRRVRRETNQDRAAAEQPVHQLTVAAVDHRLVDPNSVTTRTGSDDLAVWTLRLTNPGAATLTVLNVTVTHHLRDGSTTPWGTVAVNRTLVGGGALDLPGQRNNWPRAPGPHPRYESFDLDVRDTAGRTWHRQYNGNLDLTEGTL